MVLFSLNIYTFFHVFKTFEMDKKRFENKVRKLSLRVYVSLKVKLSHFEVFKVWQKLKIFATKNI